ncbi:response regulator transcription factor, partial [Gordonibacter urolithinfaciens]
LLSRRETEVMFLLAKGHNAAYIQDKLCISKSTAKTHISHIYRKLDIHNQQELLSMVEEARDEL